MEVGWGRTGGLAKEMKSTSLVGVAPQKAVQAASGKSSGIPREGKDAWKRESQGGGARA